jgi:hypothetical protein
VIDCVTGNERPGTGRACALPPRQLSRHVNAVDLDRTGTIDGLGETGSCGRARHQRQRHPVKINLSRSVGLDNLALTP